MTVELETGLIDVIDVEEEDMLKGIVLQATLLNILDLDLMAEVIEEEVIGVDQDLIQEEGNTESRGQAPRVHPAIPSPVLILDQDPKITPSLEKKLSLTISLIPRKNLNPSQLPNHDQNLVLNLNPSLIPNLARDLNRSQTRSQNLIAHLQKKCLLKRK